MKKYYLISKIDYDLKFRQKDVSNFNTKLKNSLNSTSEGSELKLATEPYDDQSQRIG